MSSDLETIMNILLKEKDSDLLDEILERRDCSIDASNFYNSFLDQNYADLAALDIQQIAKDNHLSLEKAYFSSLLMDLGMVGSELGGAMTYNRLNDVKCLDNRNYYENSYLKNVHPKAKTIGNYSVSYNNFLPYEGFIFDDVYYHRDNLYSEINHLGFFTKDFKYLELLYKDKIWMSITPYEIETMKKPISKAKGHVVTFGLGLGYFPYMCSLKDDVIDVTVVENDKTIIELFKKEILPFFPRKEKIHVVEADAYDYLKKCMNRCDYLFIDLYHDEKDGLPIYLNMMPLMPESLNYDFWIENSFLAYTRRILLCLVEESLEGLDDSFYTKTNTLEDKLFSGFYHLTKNEKIESIEGLLDFVSDESIRKMAKRWSVKL